jgi:hypothetical protein
MSRSAEYYRKNRKARKRKQAYDAELNSAPAQVQKRVESNRARRKARKRGQNITGKDYDHAVERFVPSRVNRGRRGEGGR